MVSGGCGWGGSERLRSKVVFGLACGVVCIDLWLMDYSRFV